jgi:hypothetical protein
MPVPGPPLAPKSSFEQSRVNNCPFEQTLWCVASLQVAGEAGFSEQGPAQEIGAHVGVPSEHHTGLLHSFVASPTQMALRSIRHCRNVLHVVG